MSCVLHVSGRSLDADALAASTSMAVVRIYRAGERRSLRNLERARNAESGAVFEVSRFDMSDLGGQIEDAVSFLQSRYDSLEMLAVFPGVDSLCMDFATLLSAPFFATRCFPPRLLILAGRLGISLGISIYPSSEQSAESADGTV